MKVQLWERLTPAWCDAAAQRTTLVSHSNLSLEGVELRKMKNAVSVCCVKSELGWESYKSASKFEAYWLEWCKRLGENIACSFSASRRHTYLDSHSWISTMHVVRQRRGPIYFRVSERGRRSECYSYCIFWFVFYHKAK